jgi:hypothetical protein
MLTSSFRKFQFAALGIVLLTVATRFPSLRHPQPIDDEAVYSVVANEIVDGGRPYIDAVERKPPLLFWTYAAVFEAAGKFNWKALHLVALIWTLGTMAGLYAIGRELFDRETGLWAALLYGVFQPWAMANNLAFNGELLMNLPLVWAWAIGFKRNSSPMRPELLLSSALLCTAFLLKQPAAIAAMPLGIYLLLPRYRADRRLTRTASFIHAAMLTTGFFGLLGLVAMVLQKQGILRDAFYWTIINHGIPHVFWTHGVFYTLVFAGSCLPLLLAAAMAYRDREHIWAGRRAERVALLGLVAASAIGAAAGARFYPHYYIQLIPPLALLAAPHLARLWSRRKQPRHRLVPQLLFAWLAAIVVAFSISYWVFLNSHRESTETGRYLFAHSNPNDRIFVWGKSPKLYLQAQRRPACRYVLTFPLTGAVFGGRLIGVDTREREVPGAWSTLEQDFAKHPPVFIVDLNSDPGDQYPVRDFPILANLIAERYRPVAQTPEGIIYRARER